MKEILVPDFELQAGLEASFINAFRSAIRNGRDDVLMAELEGFYRRHWYPNLRHLDRTFVHRLLRKQVEDRFPNQAVRYFSCACIVVAIVRQVPVAVFSVKRLPAGQPFPKVFVDLATYRASVGQDVVHSADARRIGHGAYGSSGAFASHIGGTPSIGAFAN